MSFRSKKRQLDHAMFWLEMSERAVGSLNVFMNVKTPHPFYTQDELSVQIDRFTDIVAYCLLRYQLSLEKAK